VRTPSLARDPLVFIAILFVLPVVLAPVNPVIVSIFGTWYSLNELIAFTVGVLILGYTVVRRPSISSSLRPIVVSLLCVAVVATVSLFRTEDVPRAMEAWLLLVALCGLSVGIAVFHRRQLRHILTLQLTILGIAGLMAVVDHFSIRLSEGLIVRASGLSTNPNTLSGLLTVAFPLAIAGTYRAPKEQRPLWVTLTTLLVAGIAASYARAGVYLVLLFAVLYALLRDRKLLISVVVYVLVFSVAFPGLLSRTGQGFQDMADVVTDPAVSGERQAGGTFRQRYQLATMGLIMFLENPVWGVGLGDYVREHDELIEHYPSIDVGVRGLGPHNTYVHYAAEMGALGLLALLALLFVVFRTILNLISGDQTLSPWWRSDWAVGLLGVFVTMCIYAMSNDVFMNPPLAITFWAMVLVQLRLISCCSNDRFNSAAN